jgi:hypothetical protein
MTDPGSPDPAADPPPAADDAAASTPPQAESSQRTTVQAGADSWLGAFRTESIELDQGRGKQHSEH